MWKISWFKLEMTMAECDIFMQMKQFLGKSLFIQTVYLQTFKFLLSFIHKWRQGTKGGFFLYKSWVYGTKIRAWWYFTRSCTYGTRRVLNEIAICHTTKAEVQRTVKTLKSICILRQTLFAYKMVLHELRMICD